MAKADPLVSLSDARRSYWSWTRDQVERELAQRNLPEPITGPGGPSLRLSEVVAIRRAASCDARKALASIARLLEAKRGQA